MKPAALVISSAVISSAVILSASLCAVSWADDAQQPTRHEMMKDCMNKAKAGDDVRLKADIRKACRDLTKTEKQNADAEKKADDQPAAAAAPPAPPN